MALATMQEWFGLKDEHRDFMIDYQNDARLFFARQDLNAQLMSLVTRSFRTGTPPKFVLYGDWGVGKTHTMRHIQYVIENNSDFPAFVVFVELPDITSKSTFQVAHAALMDSLGFDAARRWMFRYQTANAESSQSLIQGVTNSGDIALAFMSLLGAGDQCRISWDWLRGISLSASDARLVGLPQVLDQSQQLVKVLQMMGRLCLAAENEMLVFMLDEVTKLNFVTNQDAVNHWINAFKEIADLQAKEFGFIVSTSNQDIDDMALPLSDPQVVTRFGDQNYIPLRRLDEQEASVFLSNLLKEWIDQSKMDAIIEEYAAELEGESIMLGSFPFTDDAFKIAIQYCCRLGQQATPRDIQQSLDDLLNRSIDDGRHIVSASYLTSLVNG